jgi:predicted restriction endonuclease
MRKNQSVKKSKKQIKKLFDKECYFCGENRMELLDCHRIHEGSQGGKYNWHNMLTVCVIHHRLIHSKKIVILGKHFSTSGKWVLHYIDENGGEIWK